MTILLFDVDGTLTPNGSQIMLEMINVIHKLSLIPGIKLGIVEDGNFNRIKWQLGDAFNNFTYIFSEYGAVTYVDGVLVINRNMLDYSDRNTLNLIIKKALDEISKMPIMYHGHQIDFRKGLVYISPPGMQATNYERNFFIDMDNKFNLRKKLIKTLSDLDQTNQFEITLGDAVGIAVCPINWNKSQIMNYMKNSCTDQIYYFGNKTGPNDNGYPLYSHPDVNGISVIDYLDTIEKLTKILSFDNKKN